MTISQTYKGKYNGKCIKINAIADCTKVNRMTVCIKANIMANYTNGNIITVCAKIDV